ncbi:MAG: aspartate-semialdehyde dehydrogenase, partial [Clostridia bacterium]|nr:aspartate-semialdehyde dehydrogenase [Clostridia bacterium]
MKTYNVAVLGATGAVGREMLKVLEERNFPVGELRLLASARSVGKTIAFRGEEIAVREANENAFEGMDIVLGAATNELAKKLAPAIVKAGAIFVDNSSAFRMDPAVPLVVPEINPEDAFKHSGIVSNPNCSTIITLVAVNAINKLSPIKSMIASTYQAVSGAGIGGIYELEDQEKAIVEGGEITTETFPYQIARNLIPQIGGFNDNLYTSEEMKMQNEGRKIMHLPELK